MVQITKGEKKTKFKLTDKFEFDESNEKVEETIDLIIAKLHQYKISLSKNPNIVENTKWIVDSITGEIQRHNKGIINIRCVMPIEMYNNFFEEYLKDVDYGGEVPTNQYKVFLAKMSSKKF